MNRVILLRHGESEWNLPCSPAERKFTGRFDIPLTQNGRLQAGLAAEEMKRLECSIDHIMCSILDRARETCSLVVARMDLNLPVLHTDALSERSLGVFEGRFVEDVFHKYPEYRPISFANDFLLKAPGGESLSDVTDRAWPLWERLEEMPGRDALIVSHAVTIRCLLGKALGLSKEDTKAIHVPNATPVIVSARPPRSLLYPAFIPHASLPPSTSVL